VSNSPTPTEIQQCVFGYDDGHRLLATSRALAPADFSRLLFASDLAPGLSSVPDIDYWTGIPLADEQHYALMRTWAAPEISRPGCVWTHVVRIPFADMARFTDLSILRQLLRRPKLGEPFDFYQRTIHATPELAAVAVPLRAEETRNAALSLVHGVYGTKSPLPVRHMPLIDDVLFALWSQQWPRLRRHFSFRTAVSSHGSPRELRLDVQILAAMISRVREPEVGATDWERVAAEDFFQAQPSEFRRFLWRYGSDIRRSIDSFKTLAQIFISTRVERLEGLNQVSILESVSSAFPEPNDARLLKTDLTSFSRDAYSRLPDIDGLGTWEFLIKKADGNLWQRPSSGDDQVLAEGLKSRPEAVIELAEKALTSRVPAGVDFLRSLSRAIDADTFWHTFPKESPVVWNIVQSRPDLLDHGELSRLPSATRLALLDKVDLDNSSAEAVTKRLLRRDDSAVASLLWRKYPESVIQVITQHALDGIANAWAELIGKDPETWTRPDVLTRAAACGSLRVIVDGLDPHLPAVLAGGTQPWADALRVSRAKDDLGVLGFVLTLALRLTQPGWEFLVERSFEPVYEGIKRRSVPPRIFNALVYAFPAVPFWKEWDNCYRLALGVATAYVRRGGSIERFVSTISDWNTRRRMLGLFESLRKGSLEPPAEDE